MNGTNMVGRGLRPRRMRDSGVEWLGQVPEGWGVVRLRFLVRIATGDHDTQDADPDGAYPFYVRSPIVERASEYSFEGPGIMMAGDGAGAGRIFHYADGKYAVHQRVYRLYDFKGVGAKFLWYYMGASFPNEMDKGSAQSTVPSVRLPMLLNLPISLPPLPEQRAIAAYLDEKCAKIDGMVAEAKETIEEYKKWKASVIFEAVTGKKEVEVEGRGRERKMRDSGVEWLPQIPTDWQVYPLKRYFDYSKGLNITKADLTETGVPVISYGQIHSKLNTGTHLSDDLFRRVPEHYVNDCPDAELHENDFVFADTSEDLEGLGACAYVDRTDTVMAGYHTIVLRPRGKKSCKYLAYLFKSDCWRTQVRQSAYGIKVYSLSQRILNQCSIVLPPVDEQRAIADYLDRKCAAIDRVVAEKEALIADLEAYKKSLIFETVTGKREVA